MIKENELSDYAELSAVDLRLKYFIQKNVFESRTSHLSACWSVIYEKRVDKEENGMENVIYLLPIILLIIIYYKVFRIADDVKEIKGILREKKKEERTEK